MEQKVKYARDTSQFGYWIWLAAQKLMAGHIYCIMKCTRHQYRYAVRPAKGIPTETIRTKLADNMTNSMDFWTKQIVPVARSFSNTIDKTVR